jgi:hypothetical protein
VNPLPKGTSQDSQTLYEVAKELASLCPPHLGEEIIVIGSVAWGIADADSDVDLEFWVRHPPSLQEAMAWLEEAGAVSLIPNTDPDLGVLEIVCRYQGIWLEANWQMTKDREELVQAVLAGKNTNRVHLAQAWNVVHAVPLRSTGIWEKCQRLLSRYPDVVQERVIASASEFWTFPHRVEVLWTLARRHELLGLTTWLMADVSDALRILFAVNRQWEMDWKHLQAACETLATKPDRLIDRINHVFSAVQLEQRVETSLLLILDILDLVPSSYDVTSAATNIRESLCSHTSLVRDD